MNHEETKTRSTLSTKQHLCAVVTSWFKSALTTRFSRTKCYWARLSKSA